MQLHSMCHLALQVSNCTGLISHLRLFTLTHNGWWSLALAPLWNASHPRSHLPLPLCLCRMHRQHINFVIRWHRSWNWIKVLSGCSLLHHSIGRTLLCIAWDVCHFCAPSIHRLMVVHYVRVGLLHTFHSGPVLCAPVTCEAIVGTSSWLIST